MTINVGNDLLLLELGRKCGMTEGDLCSAGMMMAQAWGEAWRTKLVAILQARLEAEASS